MDAAFSGTLMRNIYIRLTTHNTVEFENKIAQLEGAEAVVSFSSSMSAVFSTLVALMKSGDYIISSRAIFGSTHGLLNSFLPRWNITHSYFDDLTEIESLINRGSKVIFVESPTNPGVDILDLEAIGKIAKKHKDRKSVV